MSKATSHFDAKNLDTGEWVCQTCGGESFDFELFQEYGEEVHCLAMGAGLDPKTADMESLKTHADVQRARKHIDDARAGMEKLGAAAKGVRGPDGVTGPTASGYWEEGEEITSRAADGSIVLTHKSPDRWVDTSKPVLKGHSVGVTWIDEASISPVSSALPVVSVDRGGIKYSTGTHDMGPKAESDRIKKDLMKELERLNTKAEAAKKPKNSIQINGSLNVSKESAFIRDFKRAFTRKNSR